MCPLLRSGVAACWAACLWSFQMERTKLQWNVQRQTNDKGKTYLPHDHICSIAIFHKGTRAAVCTERATLFPSSGSTLLPLLLPCLGPRGVCSTSSSPLPTSPLDSPEEFYVFVVTTHWISKKGLRLPFSDLVWRLLVERTEGDWSSCEGLRGKLLISSVLSQARTWLIPEQSGLPVALSVSKRNSWTQASRVWHCEAIV